MGCAPPWALDERSSGFGPGGVPRRWDANRPSISTGALGCRKSRAETLRAFTARAAIAFVAIALCASSYAPRIAGRVAASGLLGAFLMRPYFGAFERLFYAAIIAWFVVVAIRIL